MHFGLLEPPRHDLHRLGMCAAAPDVTEVCLPVHDHDAPREQSFLRKLAREVLIGVYGHLGDSLFAWLYAPMIGRKPKLPRD